MRKVLFSVHFFKIFLYLTKNQVQKHQDTHAMSSSSSPPIDCPVCSDPIDSCFGVFDCGHFACYKCALKIRRTVRRENNQTSSITSSSTSHSHNNNNNASSSASANTTTTTVHGLPVKAPPGCYVCRKQISSLTITEMAPKKPDSYIYEKSDLALLTKADGVNIKKFLPLNCLVTSDRCASKLQTLIDFVCPFDQCWDVDKKTGSKSQIPFNNFDLLQKHLRQDHNGCRFCEVCATQSVSFLSELTIYTPNELRNHIAGTSSKDSQAFTGHPTCQFCHNKTLLDGEAMLEHLKHVHYVCDFCNISSYRFIYYNDRESLNRHWSIEHKLCTHPDCAQYDPVARVFGNELDLARHMQERHNVKPKSLSLEAFGFRFNDAEISIPARNNNTNNNSNGVMTSAANLQLMATQAAMGNTLITYDFVGSTTVVPLVPRTMNANDGVVAGASSSSATNGGGRRQPRSGGKWKNNNDGRKNDDDDAAQQQQQEEALKKIQQENARKDDELKKRLDEADETVRDIVSNLSAKNRDVFKDAARKFIQQEIKAVEFFITIQKVVTEEDTLELLFDNFIETLRKHRNPTLREALISAKAIIHSSEAKRAKEVAREEEQKINMDKKKEQIRKLHQLTIVGNGNGGGGGGGSKGKPISQAGGGNYWQQTRSSPAAANPETTNIYKKSIAISPTTANNPWTKKMDEQSAMFNNHNNTNKSKSNSDGNNGSGKDDSAEFGFSLSALNNNNNNSNAHANNGRATNTNHNNNNTRRPVVADEATPSLTEAFPTLPTSNRKAKASANQVSQPKGAWKNGSHRL